MFTKQQLKDLVQFGPCSYNFNSIYDEIVISVNNPHKVKVMEKVGVCNDEPHLFWVWTTYNGEIRSIVSTPAKTWEDVLIIIKDFQKKPEGKSE